MDDVGLILLGILVVLAFPVIAITIGKAFLVDLAGLTGIFRALSFIGLGIVLVGIGWLYQRLLFPPRGGAITEPAKEPG